MTISTQQAAQTFLGNGLTSVFTFSFIADAAEDIQVVYTDADGNQTVLLSSQYTLTINAPGAGQLWGIGGTVTYPTSGSPIDTGTSLTVKRIVPFQQLVTISNQGDFSPQVIEQALDVLELQIQQAVARAGQFRGTWATGVDYNYGDIVVDGVNGANTTNWYICLAGNTSDTWTDDLAAGDWSLILDLESISNPGTVAAGGDLTGNYPDPVIAPNKVTNAKLAQMAAYTIKGNNTSSTANAGDLTVDQVMALLGLISITPQGRITLTHGSPVMNADATAQTTVYYDPYLGCTVPVYDGTQFVIYSIGTGLSLALDSNSGHTGYQSSGGIFDLFAFLDGSGVLTLGTGPRWTTVTARASAISRVNGLWVNTSTMTVRFGSASGNTQSVAANKATYLGSMYATADGQSGAAFKPAGASGGSNNIIGVWNAYNRVSAFSISRDTSGAYTYASATWRNMNNSASNRVSWVAGLSETSVRGQCNVIAGTASAASAVGIGVLLDSTGAPPNLVAQSNSATSTLADNYQTLSSFESFLPTQGFHFIQAVESSLSAATATLNLTTGGQTQELTLEFDY